MHAIPGYQLHYTLEGGGTLLIHAEPPDHVRIITTRPNQQAPQGEPSLLQESHADPHGCELLLYGDHLDEMARQYLEMYRSAFGNPDEMTVLPPGASRYFPLGGTDGYPPVALIIQASPPEHLETIIRTRLPDGRTVAVPLLQERIPDPEGYAAFMSNTGVDEVATRYLSRYEERFGRVVEDSPSRHVPRVGRRGGDSAVYGNG